MTTESGRQAIPDGSEVELINKAREAEPVVVDGIAGLVIANGVVKVNCFHQFMEVDAPGKVFGKYNVTLNIPIPQFLQITEVLKAVADDISADAIPQPKQA